jgi:hypothetical protein
MARVQVFAVDTEGAREVVEDLLEALDVCGFPHPLEEYQDEDALSATRRWVATIDQVDPNTVMQEWGQVLSDLRIRLLSWYKEDQTSRNLQRAIQCLRMAEDEMQQCLTILE